MKSLPLLILLLTATTTLARLGETKAECEKRYGKPVGTTEDRKPIYLKSGLEIVILFWNDKAVMLKIARPKSKATDIDSSDLDGRTRDPLSEFEMNVLLKANSGNSEWKHQPKEGDFLEETSWNRTDGKASASYYLNTLRITNTEEYNQMIKEINEKETDKLKDFGGLGETRAQCDKRYGKPIKATEEHVDYRKDVASIQITFWNGKAARLIITPKSAAAELGIQGVFLGHEQNAILEANAQGSQWKKDETNDDFDRIVWNRADGKANAIYNHKSGDLILASEDYSNHLKQEREKEEAKNLDGF